MSVHFEEVRLRLPHIELAARLYGPEDGAPVLAVHGWLDNAASFARLAPKLEGVRIIALDLAGHGHSEHRPPGSHYALWDYAYDILQVAEHMGWQRFALLGHSLGAIISTLLASALPERVTCLALIDGIMPATTEAANAPKQLRQAMQGQLAMQNKRKPVYPTLESAVEARMNGIGSVSREAARLLVERGSMATADGYTWRADNRLRLASPLRLDPAQAEAFLTQLETPTDLVIAEQGLIRSNQKLFSLLQTRSSIQCHQLPGGHHLHLDDESGAQRVADCFKHLSKLP